jgi:FixJ family two-component response regulator
MRWLALSQQLDSLRRCEEALSDRERRVLELLSKGALNKTIAVDLRLSVRMIETYRASLMKKFSAKTAPELAAKFARLQAHVELADWVPSFRDRS